MIKLYHHTAKENLEKILKEGLILTSRSEQFTELRSDAVFCWLLPEDQKIFDEQAVCLEIKVKEDR